MTDTTQPEAPSLADEFRPTMHIDVLISWGHDAVSELRRLQADQAELTACVTKQREILRNVVIAVRGLPPEDMGWSSHDAAELVQSVVADRDRLQAENESLRADAGPRWQPIETAPRDGTTVLLASAGRVTTGDWFSERWPTESEYHSITGEYIGHYETGQCIPAGWCSWDGGFTDEDPPTHWMPLPPAPPSAH